MPTELTITAALLIGLLGSSHCLGMCGGVASMLSIGGEKTASLRLFSYNLGRIVTYTLIGAVAGLLGQQVSQIVPGAGWMLRAIAGLLLIAMGLYLSQWWMGLTRLEQWGAKLWQKIQPLTGKLLPIRSHKQAVMLGSLWGFLPCGLVYSTVSWSLAVADWKQSALFMLAFGMGTLPAMLSMGLISQQLLDRLRSKNFRRLASVVVIAMGLVTIVTPVMHQSHHGMNHGTHQESSDLHQNHSHHH